METLYQAAGAGGKRACVLPTRLVPEHSSLP